MNNALAIAYPAGRRGLARIFMPLVEPRSYLRFAHLLLMMPLGIAYFTFFITAFTFGGSLIWTFIGPPVIFLAMYLSLKLGDLEAFLVNLVTHSQIRRPPARLEGVTSFRDKVWSRVIDPSTWTGLVYEFAQFPIGIAAFIATVTGFFVSFYLMLTPLIIWLSGEPVMFGEDTPLYFDRPIEGLPLLPLGFVCWLLTVHVLTLFSVLHSGWAQLMLGTRSRHLPTPSDAEPEPQDVPPPPPPIALLPSPAEREAAATEAAVIEPPTPTRRPVEEPPADPAFATLTAREREVTLLLARGFSNADIAEYCVISEGTVKTHVLHILEKLNLRDRTQVVIYAYENGLVRPGAHTLTLEREALLVR